MYNLQNVHDCNSLTSGKSVVKILSSVIFCETEFFWHTVCRNVTEKCSYKIIMSSNLDFITTTALCNTSIVDLMLTLRNDYRVNKNCGKNFNAKVFIREINLIMFRLSKLYSRFKVLKSPIMSQNSLKLLRKSIFRRFS